MGLGVLDGRLGLRPSVPRGTRGVRGLRDLGRGAGDREGLRLCLGEGVAKGSSGVSPRLVCDDDERLALRLLTRKSKGCSAELAVEDSDCDRDCG